MVMGDLTERWNNIVTEYEDPNGNGKKLEPNIWNTSFNKESKIKMKSDWDIGAGRTFAWEEGQQLFVRVQITFGSPFCGLSFTCLTFLGECRALGTNLDRERILDKGINVEGQMWLLWGSISRAALLDWDFGHGRSWRILQNSERFLFPAKWHPWRCS